MKQVFVHFETVHCYCDTREMCNYLTHRDFDDWQDNVWLVKNSELALTFTNPITVKQKSACGNH